MKKLLTLHILLLLVTAFPATAIPLSNYCKGWVMSAIYNKYPFIKLSSGYIDQKNIIQSQKSPSMHLIDVSLISRRGCHADVVARVWDYSTCRVLWISELDEKCN